MFETFKKNWIFQKKLEQMFQNKYLEHFELLTKHLQKVEKNF
jgi:hypothetical protein